MGLRDEIIESQKARADLFKWKIILVAAIGAAVLGVGDSLGEAGKTAAQAGQDSIVSKREYLLCLAPLVCVYTDILVLHLNLRIRVIGKFLRLHPLGAGVDDSAAQHAYEVFVDKARQMAKPSFHAVVRHIWSEIFGAKVDAFVFEDIALHVSTMLLSLFVVLWGVAHWRGLFPGNIQGDPRVFWAAGLLGAAVSAWTLVAYHRRVKALDLLARSELKSRAAQVAVPWP
jgi:hypothetical protein